MEDILSDTYIGGDFVTEVESNWLLKLDQNDQIEDDLYELKPTISGRRDRTVVDSQDSGYQTDSEQQLFSLYNLESICEDDKLMAQLATDPLGCDDVVSETSLLLIRDLQSQSEHFESSSQQDAINALPDEQNLDIFNIQIIGNKPHGIEICEAVSFQDNMQASFLNVNPSEINTQEDIVQEQEVLPNLELATEPMESSSVPEPPKRRGRPRKLNPKPKQPKIMKWQNPDKPENKAAVREHEKRLKKKLENTNRENEILRLQKENVALHTVNKTLHLENENLRIQNAKLSQELELVWENCNN